MRSASQPKVHIRPFLDFEHNEYGLDGDGEEEFADHCAMEPSSSADIFVSPTYRNQIKEESRPMKRSALKKKFTAYFSRAKNCTNDCHVGRPESRKSTR